SPGAPLASSIGEVAPARERSGLIACAALVALAVGWNVALRIVLDARSVVQDERAIASASGLFHARVAWSKSKLESIGELVGEDPRLKATLATPDDVVAIKDYLEALRHRIGPSTIAVVGPNRTVIAAAGEQLRPGFNLAKSQLVGEAIEHDDA